MCSPIWMWRNNCEFFLKFYSHPSGNPNKKFFHFFLHICGNPLWSESVLSAQHKPAVSNIKLAHIKFYSLHQMIIDGKYNCGSIFDSISSFHLPSSAFPQYLLLNGPVQRTLKEITNCETYFDNKPQTMNTQSSKIQKGYLCGGLK